MVKIWFLVKIWFWFFKKSRFFGKTMVFGESMVLLKTLFLVKTWFRGENMVLGENIVCGRNMVFGEPLYLVNKSSLVWEKKKGFPPFSQGRRRWKWLKFHRMHLSVWHWKFGSVSIPVCTNLSQYGPVYPNVYHYTYVSKPGQCLPLFCVS